MTENLEDFLFTLEICRRELPAHAHPIHRERLDKLERWLKAGRVVELVRARDIKKMKTETLDVLAERVHAYAHECARSAPPRELTLKALQIYREHFFDGEPGEEAADCFNQAFTTAWEREGADRRRKRTTDYYRKDVGGDTLVLAEIDEDDCWVASRGDPVFTPVPHTVKREGCWKKISASKADEILGIRSQIHDR